MMRFHPEIKDLTYQLFFSDIVRKQVVNFKSEIFDIVVFLEFTNDQDIGT